MYIFTSVKTTGDLAHLILKQVKMQNSVKQQTRKIGVAGGFINQLMGNNQSVPVVGEGATILMYSDRHAYEVIEVSEDKNSCVIRQMTTKNVGESYGDERYTYHSNEDNHTRTIEWNDKKQCWGEVTYKVEIIKALWKKYHKQYGWDSTEILLKDHGIESYNHLYEDPTADNFYNDMKIIPGVTKQYKNFNKVSIIFGVMEQYRDPSF